MLWKSLACVLVLGTLLAVGFGALLDKWYPFVNASEEARSSLNVTATQLAELKGARFWSEGVAYAILFSFLSLIVVVASLCSARRWIAGHLGGTAILILAAIPVSLLGVYLAFWFDENVDSIQDAMVRSLVRWGLLLLPPISIICVVASVLGRLNSKIVDVMVGGILGACVGLGCFLVLHGTLTTYEARPPVLPDVRSNRYLVGFLFLLPPAFGIMIQLIRFSRQPAQPPLVPKTDLEAKAELQ